MFNWKYSDYSKINKEVKDNFPFKTPRNEQLETISEIKEAIDNGYKYIILEAGTGTGKSAIAATLASLYDSSYILTVTKQLQDQYLNDFSDLGFKVVKGRGNFQCRKYEDEGVTETCDLGRCVVEGHHCLYSINNMPDYKRTKKNTCHYYYQKGLALQSKVVISNYHYLFLELNYVEDFKKRSLLICDEAHNLESTLMNLLTLDFKRKELKEYLGINISKESINQLENGNYEVWISFVEKIKNKYSEELEKIIDIQNKPELGVKVSLMKKKIDDCNRFIEHIIQDPKSWIFDYDVQYGVIEFKPLKVDKYAKNTLFEYADICIFMSATILDYNLFSRWLGISPGEFYAIRRKSPFDFKRNSIKTYDRYSLSFKASKKNAPKTIDTIKLILENHKNEKGIIHTVSNSCKNFLIKSLNNSRLIDHETSNRSEQLENFRNSEDPLVLISPSMNEGVDLPGDLCRFQIMYKLPKPDFSDKQVRLRTEIDEFWYDYKTALSLVQTHGRGMRFADDYCKTYFIDNRLYAFVKKDLNGNNFLPEYFRNAIDAIPVKINSDDKKDYFANESHKDKINRKYRLVLRADQFLKEEKYDLAIKFYNSLLKNDLFINDYHPYRKLARAYHGAGLYEKEADIIVDFFKSGKYCNKNRLDWFTDRLIDLSEMGYFDISEIDGLVEEFNSNGKLNRVLSNQPVPIAYEIRRIMKYNGYVENLKYPPEYFDSICQMDKDLSYDEQVTFKYKLYKHGNKLIEDNKLDEAIGFYNRLLNHELFINDYHPYRKLAKIYRKNRQYTIAADIIVDFFKSGRYCNKKQFRWFCNQLEDLSSYGNFNINELDDLKEEFFDNGAKNKSKSNEPVLIAARFKKLYQTKFKDLNSVDYMKDFYKSQNKTKSKNVFVKNNIINEKYNEEYFYNLSEVFLKKSEFKNKKELIEHYREFIEVGEDYEIIEDKADLIRDGMDLEKDDYNKSVEFYESLKNNELFIHDYYPYRRLCIIFKHELHKPLKIWDTIISLFENKVYCNQYQFIWINKLIDEIIDKLDLSDNEISKMDDLLEKFEKNKNFYKEIQNTPVIIADRIVKEDGDVVLISQESYDKFQHIFYEIEYAKSLIRNEMFDFAVEYHVELLKRDSFYFKYFACKGLGNISKKLRYGVFIRYFKKYENDFLKAIEED